MNTYQRQLLDKLITELTDNPDPSLHAAQMLAAELKGAMKAQTIEDGQSDPQIDTPTPDADMHPITCDCAECVPNEPAPDADGWVENTGIMPECEISAIKYKSGRIEETTEKERHWRLGKAFYKNKITHYKPA